MAVPSFTVYNITLRNTVFPLNTHVRRAARFVSLRHHPTQVEEGQRYPQQPSVAVLEDSQHYLSWRPCSLRVMSGGKAPSRCIALSPSIIVRKPDRIPQRHPLRIRSMVGRRTDVLRSYIQGNTLESRAF